MNFSFVNTRFSLFHVFCILLLLYMIWPGPTAIGNFKPLPQSAKSTLEGDTIQIPNVSAYFSNNFRSSVIPFYFKNYQDDNHFPFPPLRLNHNPEYSWTVIKKPTDTTYLEEFVYPLRASLFVNGFETHRPDGSSIFVGAPALTQSGQQWFTKVTLRLYTANLLVRIFVWAEIVMAVLLIGKLGRRIIKE